MALWLIRPWPHTWQVSAFYPVWTPMWSFRCPDWLNVLSHTWHLYDFSPLWIRLWLTRWDAVVNRLLQRVHSNGFCPEWLHLCIKSLGYRQKATGQKATGQKATDKRPQDKRPLWQKATGQKATERNVKMLLSCQDVLERIRVVFKIKWNKLYSMFHLC